MGKRYNDAVSKRNIPHLDLYTWMIGLSEAIMIINCFLTLVFIHFEDKYLTILSIVFLITAPMSVVDERKSERGLGAVVRYIFLTIVFSGFFIWYYKFWQLLLACAIELFVSFVIIKMKPWMFSVKKKQKGNKKDVILKQRNKRS
jgi:predicted membrane protein